MEIPVIRSSLREDGPGARHSAFHPSSGRQSPKARWMGKLRHIGKDPRPAGRAGGAGNWTRSVTGPPHPHPPLQTSGLAPASGCWLEAAVPRTSPATTLGGNAAVTRAGAGRLARARAGPTRRSLPPPPPTDIAECRTPGACANGHCPGRGWGWGWRGARTAAGAWTPTCAARATGPRRAPARAPPLAPSPDPSVAVLAPTAGSGGPASCVQPGAQVSLCMAGPRLLCGAQLLPFIIWGGPGPGRGRGRVSGGGRRQWLSPRLGRAS